MEKEKQEPQYCVDCKHNIVNNYILLLSNK